VRVAVGAAAVLLALALTLYPLTYAPLGLPLALPAALSVLAAALAVTTSSRAFLGPALTLFIVEYAASLLPESGRLDLLAPIVAVLCLVLLESIDAVALLSRPALVEPQVLVRRARHSARVAAAGGAAATLALAAAGSVRGGHPVLLFVGALSAGGVLALVVSLAVAHTSSTSAAIIAAEVADE
jgi:hypothetical protein